MTKVAYDDLLAEIEEITDKNNLKDYHAFVYWFIETNYGMEGPKILNSICDGAHDKGIDAVIIDDIERRVIVIQSKYERAGNTVQVKESEIKLLAAVKDYFTSRKALGAAIEKGNEVVKRLLTDAFDGINKKNYSLELAFITTHKRAPQIDSLIRDTYGFRSGEFTVFDYQQIKQLHSDRLRDFTPHLPPYNLPFHDADKSIIRTSTHKSWVLTVPLDEIRSMVNKYADKLFMKNVRNFLGDNRCNRRIRETVKNDPHHFWYYNNGISILCDDANIVMESKYIRLVNPQIVNGCQTARSIAQITGEIKGDVMVRIIASKDHEFVDRITFYQNSANPVEARDLKSNDPIQVRLKREFKLQGYYYEIKRGESHKEMSVKYPALKQLGTLNNEEVAKALAAIKLSPGIAAGKGSKVFFDDSYDDLFNPQISTFNCFAPMIHYWTIQETYKSNKESFHEFEKAYVFKNPATHYVLRFIYDSIATKNGEWEKNLVSFFHNDRTGYQEFVKEMEKAISSYFEIIYKGWKASKEPNHNNYLKNSSTYDEITERSPSTINKLAGQAKKVFEKHGLI